MKKNNTVKQSSKRAMDQKTGPITIGLDLGDKTSCYCALDSEGGAQAGMTRRYTRKAMAQKFSGIKRCRIAMEVGTHSPWLSRWLSGLGFEVIVAKRLHEQLISAS